MLGAQEKTYVGAQACRSCHPSQFSRQSDTGHAGALHRATKHPLAARFAPEQRFQRPPNFQFEFLRTPEGLRVRANDSKYVTELPLEWAFGAGDHAVTFVSKVSNEHYLEHAFTYYSDTKSFDITPRHELLPCKTLHQAMGQPLKIRGSSSPIRECFQCHSTGPVSVSAAGAIRVTEPGVHCEVCHGPGGVHVQAVSRGDLGQAKTLIRSPKALSAAELNRFCGTCHRFPGADGRTFEWNNPWNVRHQPPYFQQSNCFQKSSGALSCLTCHNPHEKVRRSDSAYYSQKCAACHSSDALPPRDVCKAPEAPDCTSCHMPNVAVSPHLKFKNHWIGVYLNGSAPKPSR